MYEIRLFSLKSGSYPYVRIVARTIVVPKFEIVLVGTMRAGFHINFGVFAESFDIAIVDIVRETVVAV